MSGKEQNVGRKDTDRTALRENVDDPERFSSPFRITTEEGIDRYERSEGTVGVRDTGLSVTFPFESNQSSVSTSGGE